MAAALAIAEPPADILRHPRFNEAPAAAPPEQPRDGRTLRQLYVDYLDADQLDNAAGTRAEYFAALKKWEALTDNRPIDEITSETVTTFKAVMRQTSHRDGDAYSPATVNKTLRHLNAIFNRIAPQAYRNPYGVGIIQTKPVTRPLRRERKLPRILSFTAIDQLYQAADVATWPKAAPNKPLMWRTFAVLLYNFGARKTDLLGLHFGNDPQQLPPDARGLVDLDRGILRFVARKTGKIQDGLPLNDIVRGHLEQLAADGVARVFPVTRGNKQFYNQWKAINAAAGFDPPAHFTPANFRKTCATNYEVAAPGSARWILGHAAGDVTDEYYIHARPQIAAAVKALPQPPSFSRILHA